MIILQNCSSAGGEVEVPQNFKNYISGVGNYTVGTGEITGDVRSNAFRASTNLTGVTIGTNTDSIGQYAFAYCTGLNYFTLESGAKPTNINSNAFEGCPDGIFTWTASAGDWDGAYLKDTNNNAVVLIKLSSNYGSGDFIVTYGCKVIAIQACFNTPMNSVDLGNTVEIIGRNAFGNTSLQQVIIPDSVTRIGGGAFSYCNELTTVQIGSNASYIDYTAFMSCPKLESITVSSNNTNYRSSNNCLISGNSVVTGCKTSVIPADPSVMYIGSQAFYGSTGLTSIVFPSNITRIDQSAFSHTGLTSVTIPDTVTYLAPGAFNYCTDLTTASVGNGISTIYYSTFEYCTSLISVYLPSSLTNLNGFYGCTSLADIYYDGTKNNWRSISKDSSWDYNTGNYVVHCSDGDIDKSGNDL